MVGWGRRREPGGAPPAGAAPSQHAQHSTARHSASHVVLRGPVAPRAAHRAEAQLSIRGLVGRSAALGQGGPVERHDVAVAKVAAQDREGRTAALLGCSGAGRGRREAGWSCDPPPPAALPACLASLPVAFLGCRPCRHAGPPVDQITARHVGHSNVAVVFPAGMQGGGRRCGRWARQVWGHVTRALPRSAPARAPAPRPWHRPAPAPAAAPGAHQARTLATSTCCALAGYLQGHEGGKPDPQRWCRQRGVAACSPAASSPCPPTYRSLCWGAPRPHPHVALDADEQLRALEAQITPDLDWAAAAAVCGWGGWVGLGRLARRLAAGAQHAQRGTAGTAGLNSGMFMS